MGARSEGTMRVHVHTKFCFLCVLTFLFQCVHCHDEGQHGERRQGEGDGAQSDLQISQAPYAASGATLSPGAGAARGGDTLEEEQRFYIQQLFSRYGRKDQLDFEGFQSLLLSLGLGEVKVVGVEHEELGHDHVAHLDMLEVQDGLHSHAPGPDGHGHGQANPGNPVDHHHQHPHTEQAPTKCSDVEPTADGPPHDHDHDHEHDHHEHDHHEHDHDSDSHHKHDGHNHEDEEQAQTPASDEDVSRPHEHGDTPLRQTPPTTQTPSAERERLTTAQAEPPGEASRSEASPTAAPESRSKRPRNRAKGPRGRNKAPAPLAPLPGERDAAETHRDHGHDHDHPHGHRGQHGHAHSSKEKREAPGGFLTPTLPGPLRPGHLGGVSHQHEECLNLTQLLTYYGLNPDSLISPVQFAYLCPALLYQIDSRFCIRHTHQLNVEQEELPPVNSAWVWVWGFVSITIISLLSLLGVVLVPILNQACFKFLLTFLVALAVGTLSGDALLHLLPHSQGQHSHSPPGEVQEEKEEDWLVAFDGVWKGLTALAGIYLLFIIEHCIGMFKHYKDQGGTFCVRKGRGEEAKIGRKLSDHKLNRRSDAEWLHLKPLDKGPDSSGVSCDNGHNDTQLTELQPPDSPTLKEPLAPADPRHPAPSSPAKESSGGKVKKRGHGHSHGHGHAHGGNCHTDQEMKDAGIASIAWMVIMGDGMHNFSDGLAIGAAFSANITGGISTSVAVFCHELPHELGDFAVLLKAGMSVKQAIVYNLLSALMAYVGMLIGTAVGQYTHNVTSWIFAITAGMFLYVALVDMLPEMLHGDSEEHKRCQLGHFVLQNLGLMTGFVIMLLIAIFEDRIVIDFGFQ